MEKMIIRRCSAKEAQEALEKDAGCQLIDVREFPEFASERVKGAKFAPLSAFDKHAEEVDVERPVYLMCRSGRRAEQAAKKLAEKGHEKVFVIEGGMTAWSSAGQEIEYGETNIWSLERQVRFAAGSLVLIGVLLSLLVHQWFIFLSAFVGAGLVFAAVTDTCGMAMMLARMPWNRAKDEGVNRTVEKAV